MFLATLFSIYLIWSFQDRFSSSKTPRNFIDSTLSTLCFLISNLGNKRGRSSLLLGLWKREYFVFSTLRESLFTSNHSLIFCSSWLTEKTKFLNRYVHQKDSCHLQTLRVKSCWIVEIIYIQQEQQWFQYWALRNPVTDILSVCFKVTGYWNILYSVSQVATEPGKVNVLDTIHFKLFY